jgi:Flp pilus assembly protein TadG
MAMNSRRRRGHAVIEVALMAPWIFFLFIGVIDVGFYSYAAINVENSARAAALYLASGPISATDQATACSIVTADLVQLQALSTTAPGANCGVLVVTVPTSAPASLDGVTGGIDAQVTVTYAMKQMFPIPGLMGSFTITRGARVRVNNLT